VSDTEPPQRSDRIIVSHFLAKEFIHWPEDGVERRRAAVLWAFSDAAGGRERSVERVLPLALRPRSVAAQIVNDMSCLINVDNREAKLLGIIASVLMNRFRSEHLGEILPDEGSRGHNVELGAVQAMVEDIMNVSCEDRLNPVLANQAEKIGTGGIIDVVVVARFFWIMKKQRVVHEEEYTLVSAARKRTSKPRALVRFDRETGIQYRGVE
jgi:hypothetical protein